MHLALQGTILAMQVKAFAKQGYCWFIPCQWIYEKEQDSLLKAIETTGSHTRGGRISHLVLCFVSF